MMVLAFLRMPIALAMGMVGIVGYAYMRDWSWAAALATAQTKVYETGRNYTLSVVPLFILMGNFVTRAGMSQELFRAAYAFIGHLRGGLAMATIVGCAGFGAICGSSIATAATFAKVAYPSMKKFGYSDALATGAIASGGTLGILIPPSTIMVIYGIMTEHQHRQAVRRRHPARDPRDAAAVPRRAVRHLARPEGRPAAASALSWRSASPRSRGSAGSPPSASRVVWQRPSSAGCAGGRRRGRSARSPCSRLSLIYKGVTSVIALFALVMGGIYGGVFTAVEGAGVGAFGALVFALARRALSWKSLYAALVESARTTSMLFMILIGALMFAEFVNITTMPDDLKSFVVALRAAARSWSWRRSW